ncbi:MAPEG family protein [uncultured Thiomicrorhabdus sp.]|jgi:hypothetical protein
MTQEWIFFPMIIMVLLTFFVGVRMLKIRMQAVRLEGLNPHYFLLNRGGKLPAKLVQVEQHYQNLFELPVLFYLLTITLFITQQATIWQLFLAGGFVISRLWHSWIHLGSNRLLARRNTFLIGGFILLIGWLSFIISFALATIH